MRGERGSRKALSEGVGYVVCARALHQNHHILPLLPPIPTTSQPNPPSPTPDPCDLQNPTL
eukprot:1186578-Rhodomonas_salina.1